MAGLYSNIVFETAGISWGTGAEKTVLQIIAPTNHRLVVQAMMIGLRGTSGLDVAPRIRIRRQTNAGTGGTAVTPVKRDSTDDETLQVTAFRGLYSGEPTSGDLLESWAINPLQHFKWWPDPEIGGIVVPGGTRLGLTIEWTTADYSLNAQITVEE